MTLDDWLAQLPATAAALGADRPARRILLEGALADDATFGELQSAHPVVQARAHMSQGALLLALSHASGDQGAAERALHHLETALDGALSLRASGPRLRILSQAGALFALAGSLVGEGRRRALIEFLEPVAAAITEAFADQQRDMHRGIVTFVAAEALADGAEVVSGPARAAVRTRAREMAAAAARDLASAAELAKAASARQLVDELT